ncbi:GTP cyclohydrolase I [Pseudoxanthomonas suwonensis 11-1]|uniref:GTP cyclohydrolase FolE2 n=1 Tax=Pseudoxanthomonas suwonensis (strain 11-1) TaxID=743721 RepID=E6WSB2_PSEUU|nr:GTP cyclohydrolase FolE2 [Pseudoxanthomonas suwonensis]ADV27061.1 GTP cyclohydrolase I [Pseudoxanthomonas suwonensis 11-1]
MSLPAPDLSRAAALLPDVAHQPAALARPLDWVGMEGIAIPVRVPDGAGGQVQVAAQADLSVNLHRAGERGIHMSRLYMRLQEELARHEVTPAGLRHILQASIESQAGLATRARLRLRYEALLLRRALRSDNAGWKRYPVEIEALLEDGHLKLVLGFGLEYSSTCPCSAALSRQSNAARLRADFGDTEVLRVEEIAQWLSSERGMAATPHAQRSEAKVRVELRPQFDELPLVALIDSLEASLGTPVQTAVKREDEQAFAELNAANLMFCEDAARRVASVLAADPRIEHYQATVSHFESLHPHDAVASVSGSGPAA